MSEAPRTLKQLVLGRKDVQDLSDNETELPPDLMTVNMGPSHPAMHGTVRIVLTVDGEKIVKSDVQPGYLHRCFEKEIEHATYTQVFPYTDRLNYVSPMINNCGWAMAVEKLMGLTDKLPEARRVHPRDRQRDVADHRSPDVHRRVGDGARRVHRRSSTSSRRASGSTSCSRRSRARGSRTATCASAASSKDLPPGFDDDLTLCLDKIDKRDRRGRGACSTTTRSSTTAWPASAR